MLMQPASKSELRQQLKKARTAISAQQRALDAEYAADTLLALCQNYQLKCVALYFSTEFEFDTTPTYKKLWQHHIQVVMPKLHPFCKGHLMFQRFLPTTPLSVNQFKIQEPKLNGCDVVPLQNIDAVVLPLVGFDRLGHRLGMGGGYYDRSLENFNAGLRIGYGFDVQEEPLLESKAWDVKLTHVITGSKILNTATHSKN